MKAECFINQYRGGEWAMGKCKVIQWWTHLILVADAEKLIIMAYTNDTIAGTRTIGKIDLDKNRYA